ncbi:hypothetical protein HPB52_008472 [Rhipicephalus sanguineus]|uniref:GH18 domain-containing protein n=1 Tax=Rhipicephalus sanguineus TaxID=34632 RepID=A0A9D4SVZ1_RHISA|nr:hypothetical protein HPB52_008472 [Rhipicephalus sanguineus]
MALSKERERKQYLQVFLKQYTSEFACIVESRKGKHFAFCAVCGCDISVSHGGKTDVVAHVSSKKHFHELKRRQNVSTNANDANSTGASASATGADMFDTTRTLPDASRIANANTFWSSSSDASSPNATSGSAEEPIVSPPDARTASELSTAAGVFESTESSIETSQSSQVRPAFDPEEIVGVVPDSTDASTLEPTMSPTLSDVTAENNTHGGVVEQRDLVDVASESADKLTEEETSLSSTEIDSSTLSLLELDAGDQGNDSYSNESSPAVSDETFSATLTVTDSETMLFTEPISSDELFNDTLIIVDSENMSFTEPIASDEPLSAILTEMHSSSMSFTEPIISDEPSEATLIVTESSSMLLFEEITQAPGNGSEADMPDEKSLVCAITEDFSSYWLSFGFPFRYADVYPDHLCTHYIFSALVFNEFDETDFSLYPHNFYRLEKFIRMRKQSNVTFIVSFDGDDLLRRLMSQRSSENMQLFANNVHVFLRFYDFDGFDIYKIHFTGENVDVWTDLLKARQC